mgnify:CR=1 FL=1
MASHFKQQQEDPAEGRQPQNDRARNAGHGRPRFVRAAVLMAGLAAVLAVPAFWSYEYKSLPSALLTVLVQFLVIVIVAVIAWRRTTGDIEQRAPSARTDTTGARDCRIWHTYSHVEIEAQTPHVALVANLSSHTRELANTLARQGYVVRHTNDADAMLNMIQASSAAWDFLIFDLDMSDGLQSSVDDLMVLRQTCPRLPILLISETVSRDDTSDHRRAIGDATLRKPVSENRLLAGIAAMREESAARQF